MTRQVTYTTSTSIRLIVRMEAVRIEAIDEAVEEALVTAEDQA